MADDPGTLIAECHCIAFYLSIVTSVMSRSQSPRVPTAIVSSIKNILGASAIQAALFKLPLPSSIMLPQEGIVGGTPIPRKLSRFPGG